MEVSRSKKFIKHFQQRVEARGLTGKFKASFELFLQDPFHPYLKTHKLTGKMNELWAYSVAFDCRVVFAFENEEKNRVIFLDIGTHDQVYR